MRDGIELAATVRYPYGEHVQRHRALPHRHRVLGLQRRRPDRPDPDAHRTAPSARPARTAATRTCCQTAPPTWAPSSPGSPASPPSASRCAGPAARAAPSTSSATRPTTTPTTPSRSSPTSSGWPTTRSVMVGISYSRVCRSSRRPAPIRPGLAAIAPMSPTDDLFSTGYPGGIYNDGFAAGWINHGSTTPRPPPPTATARWSRPRRAPSRVSASPGRTTRSTPSWPPRTGRSSTCLANQALHQPVREPSRPGRPAAGRPGHRRRARPVALRPPLHGRAGPPTSPSRSSSPARCRTSRPGRSGRRCIDAIPKDDAGVRQHGQRWSHRLDRPPDDQPVARVPGPLRGRQGPRLDPNALDALILDDFAAFGSRVSAQAPLPAIRFTNASDVATARADFATQTPLGRVLFDSGAGAAGPGNLESTYSADFPSLAPGGHGDDPLPRSGRVVAASAAFWTRPPPPSASIPTGGLARASHRAQTPGPPIPAWDWTPVPAADGIAFQTSPFTTATTDRRAGHPGSVGQGGGSGRGLPGDHHRGPSGGRTRRNTSPRASCAARTRSTPPDSTALFTDPTYLATDARNLSADRYSLVRIPIDPIAHTFRPGTELRVVISAPGGDRPQWTFDTLDDGQKRRSAWAA